MEVEQHNTEWSVRVVGCSSLKPHPNADSLSIVTIEGGYPCIVRTEDFKPDGLAVYIPVDSLVDTDRPEFAFLKHGGKQWARVKAIRLRGIFSMGLLIPAQPWHYLGQNVAAEFNVERWYSPSERSLMAQEELGARIASARKQRVWMPVYGVDSFRKFSDLLREGEEVVITEKIHGCNARYMYRRGKLYVGSHRTMRGATRHRFLEALDRIKLRFLTWLGVRHRAHVIQEAGDVWWEAAEVYGLKEKLQKHPNKVLFGEIYGKKIQDLEYDAPGTRTGRRFRVFDLFDIDTGQFEPWDDFHGMVTEELGLEVVPLLYRGPWRPELVSLAEGKSTLGEHLREGVVIKSCERRLALKLVGESYLLRKEG